MSQDVLAGSQPTVSLGAVLEGVAYRLQARFTALVHDLPAQTAESRPNQLLQYLHDARQQLLRAAALLHDTRKLPPLTQLVQPGGVLDIAANHARALQTTADELFRANGLLLFQRVPLFNVPDALDVLATGTYSNLPASMQDMRGPCAAEGQEQQRLLNQLNHLLYAHLLKAHLPESLKVVEVTGGYAVLSCAGLYEVQLTLFQQPYPPQVEEARQAAAAAAATAQGQPQEQQQEQQDGQQEQQQQLQAAQQQGVAEADAEEAHSQPEVRWQWTLTSVQLLPAAARQPPLRPVQLEQLLRNVRERMWLAADAAAVEAAKREGAGAAAGQQPQTPGGELQLATEAANKPALSGAVSHRSGPAASTMTGLSGPAAGGNQGDAGRGLQLDVYAADEVALPLRVMHAVLRDVTAQILLQEARRGAQQLAGPGSNWEGHLALARAERLTPGIRMLYWQRAPALLPVADAAAAATAGAAGGGGGGTADAKGAAGSKAVAAAAAAAGCPAIEVGLGSDGTVQELHMPPLQVPGSQQKLQLVLDTHTVDMVGLLLQAARVIVDNQLRFLHKTVTQQLEQQRLSDSLQLRLCTYGHLARFSEQQQQQEQRVRNALASPSAAAAAAALPDAQQQQQQLWDTLEVVLEGQPALTVSFQAWSGRLVLRCGSAYGGDGNLELGLTVHQVQDSLRNKQDRLFQQLQQQARSNPSSAAAEQPQQPQQPQQQQQQQHKIALACMQELAAGLTQLCVELLGKLRHNSFVTAARMLSLNLSHHLRTALQQHRQQQQQLLLLSPQAAARAAGGKGRGGHSTQPICLAMPSMQLPAYMLLLAAGSWCGQQQQQQQPPRAAAAVPARVSSLSPSLCMSFPRRPGADNSDGLVLMLCNAQGLPAQLLKELRLPAKLCARAASKAQQQRKQKQQQENSSKALLLQAPALPGIPAAHQQQQQRQLDEYTVQLSAAVECSKARLTYERLLLELTALQVGFAEEQLLLPPQLQQQPHEQPANGVAGQQQQQQLGVAWQQPRVRLVSIPGFELFQQLQRPAGCLPATVGLQEVWIDCGPQSGQWSVHLTGTLYSQQQQQQHTAASKLQQPQSAAAAAVASAAPIWCWQYDFWAGDDVRTALLQLQQLLHMQHFLNCLERLSLGRQQLDVADSTVGWQLGRGGGAAAEAGAAAKGLHEDGGADADADADGEGRPAKRACHRNADADSDGAGTHAAAANGAPLLNGMLQQPLAATDSPDVQQQQHQPLLANGLHGSHSNPLAAAAAGVGSCNGVTGKGSSSSGGGGGAGGLLWHWPGTGLVRLAAYSSLEAVLECGPPVAAAAAPTHNAGGDGGGVQQQHRSKVHFRVHWQAAYGFGVKDQQQQQPRGVQPSVGLPGTASSSSATTWPSSSSTTMWINVHDRQQQQQQLPGPPAFGSVAGAADGAGAGGVVGPTPRVVHAEDVLGVACCVSCSSPNVPDALLLELADMADQGCADLLLDAVAVLGWPLSQLQQWLLSEAAPAQVAALLTKATTKVPATGGGGCSWWCPSVTTSMPTGTWWQLRVAVGAELAGSAAAGGAAQQQQQQVEAAGAAAGTSSATAQRGFRQQLLLDLALACNGLVKVVVRQQGSLAGAGTADGAAAMAPAGATADAAAYAHDVTSAAFKQFEQLQPRICCLPSFGGCSWQQQLAPQFQGGGGGGAAAPDSSNNGTGTGSSSSTAKRPPLSGFWVRTRDLPAALPCLVESWTQHVTKAAAAERERAAAAAASAAVEHARAAATGNAPAAGSAPASGQQPQQQAQAQAQVAQPQQQQQQAPGQQQQVPQMQQQQQQVPQQQMQVPQMQPNQQQPGQQQQALQHAQQQQHLQQQQQQQQMQMSQQQQQQAYQHAQQQMMMAQQARAQGVAAGQNAAAAFNATAAGAAAAAAAVRPVGVAAGQMQGYVQQQVVSGGRVVQQNVQMAAAPLAAGSAATVPNPNMWGLGMPGMQQQHQQHQQQQYPAQQQHRP